MARRGCTGSIRLRVRPTDALYFRVDPKEDIEGDITRWNPRIRYAERCAGVSRSSEKAKF